MRRESNVAIGWKYDFCHICELLTRLMSKESNTMIEESLVSPIQRSSKIEVLYDLKALSQRCTKSVYCNYRYVLSDEEAESPSLKDRQFNS